MYVQSENFHFANNIKKIIHFTQICWFQPVGYDIIYMVKYSIYAISLLSHSNIFISFFLQFLNSFRSFVSTVLSIFYLKWGRLKIPFFAAKSIIKMISVFSAAAAASFVSQIPAKSEEASLAPTFYLQAQLRSELLPSTRTMYASPAVLYQMAVWVSLLRIWISTVL